MRCKVIPLRRLDHFRGDLARSDEEAADGVDHDPVEIDGRRRLIDVAADRDVEDAPVQAPEHFRFALRQRSLGRIGQAELVPQLGAGRLDHLAPDDGEIPPRDVEGAQSSWTGGENGLRGFTIARIDLFGWTVDFLDPLKKYYVLMVFAAAALWLVSRILASPFGAVIEAIRENETRARACGYDVERSKLVAFTLSGLICALAGTLSALHLAIVPLDILHYQTSGMIVMMTLLGGAGSFFGPFVGALAFLLMEDVVSLWTSHWQIVVGSVFILFVLFLPKGIWGTALAWRAGR